jgi:hypothetical protein
MLKGVILVSLLFLTGCGLKMKTTIKQEILSCEEKASQNSLQYLEQQYRCTVE